MPLNIKELKLQKSKWINFKTIMKIIELDEINKLKKLTDVYNNNLIHFLEQKRLARRIEEELSFSKKTKFFENENGKNKEKSSLYIVVSPEKEDSTSKAMMKKTKDFLEELDKKDSYFITFGYQANKLCNRMDLNILDSFEQFGEGDLEENSIKKVVAIASLGMANSIFRNILLVFPRVDVITGKLFVTKITPFDVKDSISNGELSPQEEENEMHSKSFFDISSVKKMQWFPSVDSVYSNLIESLIKLKVNIIILKHKIISQKEVVAQAKDKNKKIEEQLEDIGLLIQRGRKEQITLELLTLSTAFKLLNKSDDEIRKKEEEEEEEQLLWNQEVAKLRRNK